MPMDKSVPDLATAVLGIESGMTLMVGGFGGSGAPIELIHALIDRFRKTGSPGNLVVVNNNAGNGRIGLAAMIDHGMVAKMICSFPRSADPRAFTEKYQAGQIGLEIGPQGTLAERIRAGGAGIPAFFTKTGVGTLIAEGKEEREFDGERFIMERGLFADISLVHAWKGDTEGNLIYRKTARNFNPMMATASRFTVAQVEHLVPAGELEPDQIHTPGIFVKRIVHVPNVEKRIENRTTRKRPV